MTTASKLNYLLETKSKIKDALVKKGASVSNTDTFRSYADKIEGLSGGGGSDLVYALSDKNHKKGDKLLIKKGSFLARDYENNYVGDNSFAYTKGFIDDNTFLGVFQNSGYVLQYIDDAWTVDYTFTGSTDYVAGCFVATDNGYITSNPYVFPNGSTKRYFFATPTGLVSTGKGVYLGAINGIDYVTPADSSNNLDVYSYDMTTQEIGGSAFINGPSTARGAFLVGNRILLLSTKKDVRLYEIDENNVTTTLNSSGVVSENFAPINVTGLQVGDYVIGATSSYSSLTSGYFAYGDIVSKYKSYLTMYQIQSDYSLKKVSIPLLQWLETTDCRITFDRRNKVLVAGTQTGVYAYEFKDGTFEEMPLGFNLAPTVDGGTYMGFLSPNKEKLVVINMGFDDTNYNEALAIYNLGRTGWQVITNKTLNYQPESVYTGIATGNKQGEGLFEVATVLTEDDGGRVVEL